ncbi:hypothetical protein GCM10027347_60080 [Larkinella harenae]
MKKYNYATGGFMDVDTTGYLTYNAAGYNQVDNHIYAIRVAQGEDADNRTSTLLRLGANGVVEDLGYVTGLPTSTPYVVGDISPAGIFYVYYNSLAQFYTIDLNVKPYTATARPITPAQDLSDWAFNPQDQQLYSVLRGSGQIVKVNPTTGVSQTIIPANGAIADVGTNPIGAIWFDQFNNMYAYANTTGRIWRYNTVANTWSTVNDAGAIVGSNDAAACPVTKVEPSITKVLRSQTGNSATFDITLSNTGPAPAADLIARDVLPAGLVFQSASVLDATDANLATTDYKLSTPAVGVTGPVSLTINNLNVGAANAITLRLTVRAAAGSCNQTFSNCAEIISAFGQTANNGTLGNTTDNTTTIPGDIATNNEACAPVSFSLTPPTPIAVVSNTAVCSGELASIMYSNIPANGSVSITRMPGNVTFGGSVSEVLSNTGTTPISYTYTATYTNLYGCPSDPTVTVITVNPVPIITPSVCSQTICSGQTGIITFDVSIPGSTIHWLRTPTTPPPSSGTGNISQSLTNTGPSSLTYTYKVWAESPAPSSCTSATITCEIVVTPGLEVTAFVNSATVCTDTPLSLSANVVPAGSYTYAWTGPNGYVGVGATPTVSPTAAITQSGIYTVVVTDAAGCSGTATVPVTVANCCSLTALANAPSPVVCAGQDLMLSSSASGAIGTLSYAWSGPGGFVSTAQNPTIPAATTAHTGSYTVVITDAGTPNCTATAIVSVTVGSNPTAVATPAIVCEGSSTTLTASGSAGGVFTWIGPNGFAATGQSVVINNATASAAGNYTVTITGSNGCNGTAVASLTVNPQPVVIASAPSGTVCIGSTLSLSASVSGGTSPFAYAWSGPDGFVSTAQNPGLAATVVTQSGSYSLLVTDANGCSATAITGAVIVNNCCSLTATAGNSIVACTGGTINLAVTVGNSTTAPVSQPLTYSWAGPNGFTANIANPLLPATAIAAGTYSVTVTDGQNCTAVASVAVTVTPQPSAGEDVLLSICNNETVDLAPYFAAGGSYSALNGILSGSIFNGIASGVGSYTVTYTVGGGDCPTDEAIAVIIVRDCSVPPCNYPISSAVVDATCGNSDGRATVSLGGLPTTGATVGYAWSNGKTGPTVTGLAAGVYSVTATISTPLGTCTVVEQIQVNEIGGPVAEIDLISAADCLGANGAVAIDITSGTGPFRISWSGAATGTQNGVNLGTTTIPNLATGQYTFEITGASSNTACSSFLAITIPRDDSDRITVTATPTNATVCGSATGSIQIVATPAVGVTGPFSYSLNGVEIGTSTLPTYTINGLTAGAYTVGVSSVGGCSAANVQVVIQEVGAPVIAGWTSVDPNCPSDQGRLVFAGGQPTATFVVREAASGSIVANSISGATSTTLVLPAGTYTIEQITSNSNCTSYTTVTINRPEGLDFNVQYTKVTCAPGGVPNNDGSISIVQITGGTPPYSTTVLNAQNQVVSNLQAVAPGIYSIRVVDSGGCPGVENVFITVPDCDLECPIVPMNTFVVDANCTAADGRAVAQLGAYDENDVDYQWSNGFFGKNVSGLATGVYSVTATILAGQFVGCAYVERVNINQIGGPVVTQRAVNPSSCASNTGSVSFSLTSGTAPFTVTWNGPVSSSRTVNGTVPFQFTQTGLAPGDYIFTFKEAGSDCQTVLDVTIPVSSSSSINLTATPTPASGCGAQDGSINLTASGSGPNYIFSLNGVAYTSVSVNTVTIPNLPAGIYTVGVTSGANGCQTERQVIIQENGAPLVSGWSSQSALCAAGTGSITYAGGTGTGSYRVLLGGTEVATTPQNVPGPVVYNLPQGIYTVELTDGTCTSFQNLTITGPTGIDFNVQYVAETCGPGGVGNGDGSLNVIQVSGGTAPYTISIINNQGQSFAGASHINLMAGNYYISVVDANGCPGNEDALVTVPPCDLKCPPLAFNTSVLDNLCGETSGRATAELLNIPTGATATYAWSNGQNGPIASGLTSGVYSVTASLFADNTIYAGCMYVDTVTVNDIGGPIVSVSATAGASCTAANGSVALNIQGGTAPYTVSWTGEMSGTQSATNAGLLNITGLRAGNYVFTVAGSNSTCKSVIDVVIPNRVPNGFTLAVNPTATSGCDASDGRLTITVSGGTAPFTYSVNGYVQGVSTTRTFSVQGLPAGVYAVEVMDANGCSVNRENVLINPSSPTPIAGWTVANALCADENGTIQFAGTGIATEEYVVTIAGTATEIGRTAGNLAATYTVPGGTYLITRTISTSCVSVTTVTVTQPDGLDFNIQYQNPNCASPSSGSLAVVQPTGGTAPYSYTVTGSAGVVSNLTALTAGSYTVTMGDSRGCTFSDVITLTGGSSFSVTATASNTAICIGTGSTTLTATVTPTGSYTYVFAGPDSFNQTNTTGAISLTATSLTQSGNYTVVVTDVAGCSATATVPVSVSNCCDLVASMGALPIGNCENVADGRLEIVYSGSGTYQYNLNGGAFQPLSGSPFSVTGLAAGSYTVIIRSTTDPSCSTTLSGTIVTPTAPVVSTVVVTNPTDCTANNGSLAVVLVNSATGVYEYSIDNGGSWQTANTFPGLSAGTYAVLVRNAVAPSCFVNAGSFQIQTPGSVTATISGQNLDVCATDQGRITITAGGGSGTYEYSLDGGLTWADLPSGTITRTNLAPSNYLVVVRDKAIPSCRTQRLIELSTQDCPVPIIPPFRLTGGE